MATSWTASVFAATTARRLPSGERVSISRSLAFPITIREGQGAVPGEAASRTITVSGPYEEIPSGSAQATRRPSRENVSVHEVRVESRTNRPLSLSTRALPQNSG